MADVDISDWPLHDLAVRVSAPGLPDDGIRRNLGLLGFTNEQVPDGMPAASAKPADFHRLASRVGTWPYEGSAELVEGLAYCAFLVEGAYPVGTDFMSDCVPILPDMQGPIEFAVEHSIDSTSNPKDAERLLVPVSLTISVMPKPKAVEIGNLFLLGFSSMEEHSSRPAKGQRPSDHQELAIAVNQWPWKGEISLKAGLYYFAVWSMNENPLTGEPIGGPIKAEGTGAVSFDLVIDRNAEIPQDGEEAPPPGGDDREIIGTPKPGEPSPIDPCCEGGGVDVCRDANVVAQVCKAWSQCCDTRWEARCSELYRGLSNLCHGSNMRPDPGR